MKESIAILNSKDKSSPFVVECDASELTISADLTSKDGQHTFSARYFPGNERCYPAHVCVVKEAAAIIEAIRKWVHYFARQRFTLANDHK